MKYSELFDFSANKLLQLLDIFAENEKEQTIYEIAEKLKVSVRTTQRYLKKLGNILEKADHHAQLQLSYSNRTKVNLHRKNNLYLEQLKFQVIRELPEMVIFKETIIKDGFILSDLLKQLNLSEAHVRKKIQKIRKWLAKYHLSFERSTYRIIGCEFQVREFIYSFILYTGSLKTSWVNKFVCSVQLLNEVNCFFQIQANSIQNQKLQLLILLILFRNEQGHFIRLPERLQQYTFDSPRCLSFIQKVDKKQNLTNQEKAYLYLMTSIKFSNLFSKLQRGYFINDHYQRMTSCYEETQHAMKELRQQFIDHSLVYEECSLTAFLSFHLYYQVVQEFPYEKMAFLKELYQSYPNFIQRIEKSIYLLKQKKTFFQAIPTSMMLYSYFFILSMLISPVCNEQKRYIYLLTDFSSQKEQLVSQQLYCFFQYTYNLVIISDKDASSISYADIILATSIHEKKLSTVQQPVLFIESMLTSEMVKKIEYLLKDKK